MGKVAGEQRQVLRVASGPENRNLNVLLPHTPYNVRSYLK
jgi:hypothetical protein